VETPVGRQPGDQQEAPPGFRVDVHGSAVCPDLILVRTLSDDWGCYPTPAGQAVYFTLAFQYHGRDA